jgi:hypothetical protein
VWAPTGLMREQTGHHSTHMTRIRVDVGGLSTGAQRGAAIAGSLTATRAGLDSAAPAAEAAGAAGAVAAIGDACAGWTTALGALGDSVGQLHTNLAAAAEAYALTDQQAIDP